MRLTETEITLPPELQPHFQVFNIPTLHIRSVEDALYTPEQLEKAGEGVFCLKGQFEIGGVVKPHEFWIRFVYHTAFKTPQLCVEHKQTYVELTDVFVPPADKQYGQLSIATVGSVHKGPVNINVFEWLSDEE
jgi:hypothetical protein